MIELSNKQLCCAFQSRRNRTKIPSMDLHIGLHVFKKFISITKTQEPGRDLSAQQNLRRLLFILRK